MNMRFIIEIHSWEVDFSKIVVNGLWVFGRGLDKEKWFLWRERARGKEGVGAQGLLLAIYGQAKPDAQESDGLFKRGNKGRKKRRWAISVQKYK